MLGHLRANNQRSEKKKTPACSASVCESVSIFCCWDMGRVVKNGRTYPVQRGPGGRVCEQRSGIVRRIYDLGWVVNLVLQKCRVIDICVCQ